MAILPMYHFNLNGLKGEFNAFRNINFLKKYFIIFKT